MTARPGQSGSELQQEVLTLREFGNAAMKQVQSLESELAEWKAIARRLGDQEATPPYRAPERDRFGQQQALEDQLRAFHADANESIELLDALQAGWRLEGDGDDAEKALRHAAQLRFYLARLG